MRELITYSKDTKTGYCSAGEEQDPFGGGKGYIFHCNELGYLNFYKKFEDRDCFELLYQYFSDRDVKDDDMFLGGIDFSFLKNRENVTVLHINDNGRKKGKHYRLMPYGQIELFPNVKRLVIDHARMSGGFAGILPELEHLVFVNDAKNDVRGLLSNWPKLREVRLDHFKGRLSDLGPNSSVHYLTMIYPSLESLDGIEGFPNLKGLLIGCLRKPISVAPLGRLENLNNLRFYQSVAQTDWDKFRSRSLRHLNVSKADDLKLLDSFPNLATFHAGKVLSLKNKLYDFNKLDGPLEDRIL